MPGPQFTQPSLLLLLLLLRPRQADAGSIAVDHQRRESGTAAGKGSVPAAAAAATEAMGGGDADGRYPSPRVGSEALQASQLRFEGLHLRKGLQRPWGGQNCRAGSVSSLSLSLSARLSHHRPSVYVVFFGSQSRTKWTPLQQAAKRLGTSAEPKRIRLVRLASATGTV